MAKWLMGKSNRRVQTESELEKNKLLAKGYSVINEQGKVLELATGGLTYTAAQYNKVFIENIELKKKLARRRKPTE